MGDASGSVTLTPEQRSRIALQKSLALARRALRETDQYSSTSERIIRTRLFSPKEETQSHCSFNGSFTSTLTEKAPKRQHYSVPAVSLHGVDLVELPELGSLELCTVGFTKNLSGRTKKEVFGHEPTDYSTVRVKGTLLCHGSRESLNVRNFKSMDTDTIQEVKSKCIAECTRNDTIHLDPMDANTSNQSIPQCVRSDVIDTDVVAHGIGFKDTSHCSITEHMDTDVIYATDVKDIPPQKRRIDPIHSDTMDTRTYDSEGMSQCKSSGTKDTNRIHEIKFSSISQCRSTDSVDMDAILGDNVGAIPKSKSIDTSHSNTMGTNTINESGSKSIQQFTSSNTMETDIDMIRRIGLRGLQPCINSIKNCSNDTIHGTQSKGAYSPLVTLPRNNSKIKLSKEQLQVLKAVAARKSVFITGSAGTGKSFILGCIIRLLKKRLGPEAVYVTASTGLAACALGGITLHSFAGIGLGKDDAETMAAKVMGKQEARERWRRAEVLIIDEISMIDGDLFDKLNYVAETVRTKKGGSSCFGGIQLIVTGDFFQLPPVKATKLTKYFAFEADCWDKCFDLQIELVRAFRHSEESFVEMLNEVRKGRPSDQTLQNLMNCRRELSNEGLDIAPTRLYPLKVDVKEENMKELFALNEETLKFMAVDMAESPMYEVMLDTMRAEKEIEICCGAQVMLIVNYDTEVGLVNGAKGVVVGFDSLSRKEGELQEEIARRVSSTLKWPVVRFYCDRIERTIGPEKHTLECGGREVVRRIQVPLILAWALSVHKCQGMTLDQVETDLSKAFDYGMVYVALSRVKKLDGLQLLGFDHTKIKVHPNVVNFYANLAKCRLNAGSI